MPSGADTVVMQEDVSRKENAVTITGAHKKHGNVRMPGEDLRAGSVVMKRGKSLNAADVGLLASMGMAEVDVHRRPVVAFFSTGDELQSVGRPLAEGQLYDSNRYTLHALLRRTGVPIIDMGVVRDDLAAVRSALLEAAACADLIITSGGVSVGDADYVKQALNDIGKIDFWKIAMKPGRPLAFGNVGSSFFFGLPGNPVSAMTTFMLFVRRAIFRMQGDQPRDLLRLHARSAGALKKTPGRTDFQRGIYSYREDGSLWVETTGLQGSHVLSSMSRANCFIVLSRESGHVPAGTQVQIIPFDTVL